MENYEKIICRIYKKYNPQKLSSVNSMLEKYQDQEDELIESIFSKYNISLVEREAFLENIEFKTTENTFAKKPEIETPLTIGKGKVILNEPVLDPPSIHILNQPIAKNIPPVTEHTIKEQKNEYKPKKPVDTEATTKQLEINTENKSTLPLPSFDKKRKSKIGSITLISILVIILGAGSVIFLQYNGNINIPFLEVYIPLKVKPIVSDTTKPIIDTITSAPIVDEAITLNMDTTSVVNSDTAAYTADVAEGLDNNVQNIQENNDQNLPLQFFIIAGSFSSEQLAKEAIDKLKSQGFAGAQIVDQAKTGNYRICYIGFSTKEECMKEIDAIKQSNPSAWIYEKKK